MAWIYGDIQINFRQHPRLKDQVAYLGVEREPGDIDATLSCGEFISRLPEAEAV